MFDRMTPAEIEALPYAIEGDSDDREDWLAQRRTMLTASDIAAVLGLSPYKSALELWQEKSGEAPEIEQTPLMKAGLNLEPVILDYFNDATDRKATRAGKLLRSKRWPWLGCTLDAWDHESSAPVELKFCREYSADLWDEQANPLYVPQLMTQMLVTESTAGSFGVLVGGWDFKWLDMPLDPVMARDIIKRGYEFACMWRDGVPPSADGSKSAKEALDRQWPSRSEAAVSLRAELIEATEELDTIDANAKIAKARKDLIRNQVIEEMQGATRADLPDGTSYTYRPDKNGKRTLKRCRK